MLIETISNDFTKDMLVYMSQKPTYEVFTIMYVDNIFILYTNFGQTKFIPQMESAKIVGNILF